MTFQLPDDWEWEQPREPSNWCQTCYWNGSWPDLMHRSNLKLVSLCCPLLDDSSLRSSASTNICCAVLLALYKKYVPEGQSGYITFNFDNEFLVFNERRERVPPWGCLELQSTFSPLPGTIGSLQHPNLAAHPQRRVNTGSATSLAWAEAHIDNCLNTHACHDFGSKDRTLPTRLIEIPQDPENSGIRLRDSSDLRQDTRYVALSYRWGTTKPPCLTTSLNLAGHLEEIRWSSFPKTFQDAVLFSKKLGIGYIWIDSICIIQGDDADAEADWSRESAHMYKYYSNAHVTLAAACSSDCDGGLFTKDSVAKSHLLDLEFRGQSYPLFVSESPSEVLDFHDAAAGLSSDVENKYPLLSRAWAFQERLVSPRVIFFTKTQLIWDCYEGCAFEEDASRVTEVGHPFHQGLKQDYRKLLSQPNLPWKDSICAFEWDHVLKAYSHLQLSDPCDRLPAIAAIAEQVLSRKYDDPAAEYLCGLRKTDLHTDLLWMPAAEGLSAEASKSRREGPYVAPSWSWASYPGRIMDSAHYESCRLSTIHLIQDSLIFKESRRFSRVLGGNIVIEGPVVECIWHKPEVGSEAPVAECSQLLQVLPPSVSDDSTAAKLHVVEFIPDYADMFDEIEAKACPGQVKVCMLQTWTGTVQGRSGALVLHFNEERGVYARIGARLRELPTLGENPPWGLVDNRVFGGADRRMLVLE